MIGLLSSFVALYEKKSLTRVHSSFIIAVVAVADALHGLCSGAVVYVVLYLCDGLEVIEDFSELYGEVVFPFQIAEYGVIEDYQLFVNVDGLVLDAWVKIVHVPAELVGCAPGYGSGPVYPGVSAVVDKTYLGK